MRQSRRLPFGLLLSVIASSSPHTAAESDDLRYLPHGFTCGTAKKALLDTTDTEFSNRLRGVYSSARLQPPAVLDADSTDSSPISTEDDRDVNDIHNFSSLQQLPRGGTRAARATTTNPAGGLAHTVRVLGYFALWYALNVWYNITNKRVLNALGMPTSIAVAQLGIGSLWVGLQWMLGIRRGPGLLAVDGAARVTPVALFHGGGQLATVLSLAAGAVSFTHVVKAMEPFFSAMVAAVYFGQVFRPQVYASLLPVVSGVSLACLKEINFSWLSFVSAMTSNLMFACRANFSKELMITPPTRAGASLSSANLYGLVTVASFFLFAPVAILTGYNAWGPAWDLAMKNGHKEKTLVLSVVLSGISHYLNNEVMYLALGAVHPTTLAVGNTFKRVFIIAASLVVFKTPVSRMGVLGSAIAVGGVLVYSLTKQHFDALDRRIVTGEAAATTNKKRR